MEGWVTAGVNPAWTPRLVLQTGTADRDAGRGGEALYRGPACRKEIDRPPNLI